MSKVEYKAERRERHAYQRKESQVIPVTSQPKKGRTGAQLSDPYIYLVGQRIEHKELSLRFGLYPISGKRFLLLLAQYVRQDHPSRRAAAR